MHVWLQVGQLSGPWLWIMHVEMGAQLLIQPLKASGSFICMLQHLMQDAAEDQMTSIVVGDA